MKSSLKVPKYNVSSVLMQRQLDELREVRTMSEQISIRSDEESNDNRTIYDVVGSTNANGSHQQESGAGGGRKHRSGCSSQSKSKSLSESSQERRRNLQPKELLPKRQELQSNELGLLEADNGGRRRNRSKERRGGCTRRSRSRSRGGSKGRTRTGECRPALATSLAIVNKVCRQKEMMSRVPDLQENANDGHQQESSAGGGRKHRSSCSSQIKSKSLSESHQERRRNLQPKELLPKRQELQSNELGLLEVDNGGRRRNRSKERRGGCTRHSRSRSRGGSKGCRRTGQCKEIPGTSGHNDDVSTLLLKEASIRVEVLPNSESVPWPPSKKQHRLYDTKAAVAPRYASKDAHKDSVSTLSCRLSTVDSSSYNVKSNCCDQDQQDPQDDYRDPREGPSLMLMINPQEYDANGWCVRHPLVRLRKKKIFGRGWKVILSACPDCCVDELRRIEALRHKQVAQSLQQQEMGERYEERECTHCLPVPQEPTRRNISQDSSQEILLHAKGRLPKDVALLSIRSHSLGSGLTQTDGEPSCEWRETSDPFIGWRSCNGRTEKMKDKSRSKGPQQDCRPPQMHERKAGSVLALGERPHDEQKEKTCLCILQEPPRRNVSQNSFQEIFLPAEGRLPQEVASHAISSHSLDSSLTQTNSGPNSEWKVMSDPFIGWRSCNEQTGKEKDKSGSKDPQQDCRLPHMHKRKVLGVSALRERSYEEQKEKTCPPVLQEPPRRHISRDSSQETLLHKEERLPKEASLAISSPLGSTLTQTNGGPSCKWKTMSDPFIGWRSCREQTEKKKDKSRSKDPQQDWRPSPMHERKVASVPAFGERPHKEQKEKTNIRSKSKEQDQLLPAISEQKSTSHPVVDMRSRN